MLHYELSWFSIMRFVWLGGYKYVNVIVIEWNWYK